MFNVLRKHVSAHAALPRLTATVASASLLLAVFGASLPAQADLLVSSQLTDSVKQYNFPTGAFVGDFVPPASGGLSLPVGLAFGPDSNLYVSSFGDSSVKRYDGATGAFLGNFVAPGSGGLDSPQYLTFNGGNLFVSSFGNDSVMRYNATTGAPNGALGNPGDATFVFSVFNPGGDPRNTGLDDPVGLTFGPDGNLYISSSGSDDHGTGLGTPAVKRVDPATGLFIDNFVDPGEGGLDSPFGLAFGPDGNLYVSNFLSNQVLRFDAAGAFIDALTDPALAGPDGLAFGPDGLLYVSSSGNDSVVRFNPNTGTFAGTFVAPGAGGLSGPTGLVFTPAAAAVPEPSTLLLLGAGALAARRIRKSKGQ